jgi:hypothetical protein
VTPSKTTDGGTDWATRVATRRNADCSCDRRAPSNATNLGTDGDPRLAGHGDCHRATGQRESRHPT